tara:strand:+ start:130 stop:1371 length:1242 start_codon:yes stop_codon:yes gene_type:complete
MNKFVFLFFFIPTLSWGLTFKDGKAVEDKSSINISSDIIFAKGFYTDEIKDCSYMGRETFADQSTVDSIRKLIGYDWVKDFEENSTSLTVVHDGITEPMRSFSIATHNAVGEGNSKKIQIAKEIAIELAKKETLFDTIGYKDLKKIKYKCWERPESPCWAHAHHFAADVFINYMIASIWLKDFFNEEEYKIIDVYISKMFKKFIGDKYSEKKLRRSRGIYQMANGGIGILAYSAWKEDTKLALEEISIRFAEFEKHFYEDGYINNNSFRGVRSQWYHSLGFNSTLGYIHIAKLWGVDIPESINSKLINASKVTNLAILDYDKFRSRPWKNPNPNMTKNWVDDPSKARIHTHQDAIGIDVLMESLTGIKLENDEIYFNRRKQYGIDETIGFNPHCLVEEKEKEQLLKELDFDIN